MTLELSENRTDQDGYKKKIHTSQTRILPNRAVTQVCVKKLKKANINTTVFCSHYTRTAWSEGREQSTPEGHRTIRDKTAHLRPLHNAVQAEVMGTVLRSPNSLIPKRVEANGAVFAILIRWNVRYAYVWLYFQRSSHSPHRGLSFFLLFLLFLIVFTILKSERWKTTLVCCRASAVRTEGVGRMGYQLRKFQVSLF